jgi:hypothetical protein
VVQRQLFQWPNGVMLFSRGAGFVAFDLGYHTHGHFNPFGQALEGTA